MRTETKSEQQLARKLAHLYRQLGEEWDYCAQYMGEAGSRQPPIDLNSTIRRTEDELRRVRQEVRP